MYFIFAQIRGKSNKKRAGWFHAGPLVMDAKQGEKRSTINAAA